MKWRLEVFERARKARYAEEARKEAAKEAPPMSKSQQRAKRLMWEDDIAESEGDKYRKLLDG